MTTVKIFFYPHGEYVEDLSVIPRIGETIVWNDSEYLVSKIIHNLGDYLSITIYATKG